MMRFPSADGAEDLNWENGLSLPTIDNLYALSKLYQIPMEELLER